MRSPRLLAVTLLLAASCAYADGQYAFVPGGSFHSAIAQEGNATEAVAVASFQMRTKLVTNAEFLAFVKQDPSWRRDRVAPLFASSGYLSHWAESSRLGDNAPADQPVTKVSWFAARAFCASEHARLPDWIEWEYAAAADAHHRDARADVIRKARILAALTASFSSAQTKADDSSAPNTYGLYGMHSLVGEWVNDYAALFVNADTRAPGGTGQLQLCGGAALAFVDRTDYALLMRVAALAALAPADSANVGFRCVKDVGDGEKT
ncbi:MAG: formylglycine-generating enzyme family protein [Paraburkholderia sp.]|uniref:formylglycine-generating enzyme family protein n=1 Tax=Paraburkholderia sp. TaxID=1926495 RepID=UPI001204AB5D|nr:SUMF1/EgtB/PvdO family nonheme iron enzyme [Paraburkholderia sp.]TAM08039.1 MAG: formylglycine-generating enzyme family protein [Paraburkholderia sp.]TAM30055.1 MAG: formylglycine-generating enzyme family protein [Paraburkholderia sp.]